MIFSSLWPSSYSMISTTFWLPWLCAFHHFPNEIFWHRLGSRWILIISGPDEDCRGLLLVNIPLKVPLVIQMKFYLQNARRCGNLPSMWCKPMVGSRRLLSSNSTSVDNFLGLIQKISLTGTSLITMCNENKASFNENFRTYL